MRISSCDSISDTILSENSMGYWLWDPSLSVGIDVIDRQHIRIIDYLNELKVAKENNDSASVSGVLTGLVDYTCTHFLYEEDLMKQVGYSLSDAHKRAHDAFAAQIYSYVRRHESGTDVTRRVLSDLRVWLTNHIKKEDKDFAPDVMKANGRFKVRNKLSHMFGHLERTKSYRS